MNENKNSNSAILQKRDTQKRDTQIYNSISQLILKGFHKPVGSNSFSHPRRPIDSFESSFAVVNPLRQAKSRWQLLPCF